MKLHRFPWVIALCMLPVFFAPAAQARTLALLVGVADYDAPGIHDLLGPRNDVTLIWRALLARKVSVGDIIVLSDGLPAGSDFPVARALPRRAAIVEALDEIASLAKPGDVVMFYYSGHGSVQPVRPGDVQDEPEADGNDQVILPADVGPYDIITHSIKNAIIDNELRAKLDVIRQRGAFVWAVVDACHSGTVTRGDDVVRTVNPAVLNVPLEGAGGEERGEGSYSAIALGPSAGGIAGFFAVESYAEAIERPFTGYDPKMIGEGPKQRMGVFTYHLHRALVHNTASSFRDLAQEIVADMSSDRSGGKVPPPVFDGDLDAALFGAGVARLPGAVSGTLSGERLVVTGGVLHGFDIGSEVAIYLPGETSKPVGHARITEATAVTSAATGLAWDEGTGMKPGSTFSVVVSAPAASFRFQVSPPPRADFSEETDRATIEALLQRLVTGEASSLGISLAPPADPDADLLLRVKNGRLWILRPDRPWVETPGAYEETPSLALDGDSATLEAGLRDAVWRLARAARLLRVAAGEMPGDVDSGEGGELQISATITRSADADPTESCTKKPSSPAVSSKISALLPLRASHCDLVEVEVINEGDRDFYVAGFYIDSLGGVSVVPRAAEKTGCVRTLPMGSERPLRFSFWINTWDRAKNRPSSVGAENFVLLATPKDDTRQPPRLCALTQPTLSGMQTAMAAEMPGTRGQMSPLQDLLGTLDRGVTRGSADFEEEEGASSLTSRLFIFDVRP